MFLALPRMTLKFQVTTLNAKELTHKVPRAKLTKLVMILGRE